MAKAKVPDNVAPLHSGIDPLLAAVMAERDGFGLRLNRERAPVACLENVVTILLKASEWQGVLGFNEFSQSLEKRALPPFDSPLGDWTDADDHELDLWLSQQFDLRAGDKVCANAADLVGRRRPFHPVREYLDALAWDGQPRLATWLVDLLGAVLPDGDQRAGIPAYYDKAGTWWLISAVARVYRPGCQADHVLLLEGKQGIGKSTALRMLFEPWFSDTPLRIGDKDAYGALKGVWGYELSELDSLNRAETSASKAFFTSVEDKYRPPYGHRDKRVPRQCVFAGTVNLREYLRDSTGNRRYWPVRCSAALKLRGPGSLEEVRDQLFAEAVVRFRGGERWYPVEQEERDLFESQQRQREVGDVYEDLIRRATLGKDEVSMAELFEILNIEPAKMTLAEQTRIGKVMHTLEWVKKQVRRGSARPGHRDNRSYVYVRASSDALPGDAAEVASGAEAGEGYNDVPF